MEMLSAKQKHYSFYHVMHVIHGPRQANLVLIAYASSEGSSELAHPRSLARTSAARSYKQWVKRNLQTENQIPGHSEWLGMRLKFVMRECSTQICLTGLTLFPCYWMCALVFTDFTLNCFKKEYVCCIYTLLHVYSSTQVTLLAKLHIDTNTDN